MLDETQSYGLLKVGQNKWIQKLYNGGVSFSCARAFIFQAKHYGNDEQGDADEAVFARLKKDNPRIGEMRDLLGNDLEIIDDNLYVKLRRKSACFVPIFCIYSILYSDFISQVKKKGDNLVVIDISDKIYNGFIGNTDCQNVLSDGFRIMGAFFQPDPFFDHLETALDDKGYSFRRNAINYTVEADDEFFIKPTDNYEELFYKRPKYEYQHEVRTILLHQKIGFCDRVNIQMQPLNDKDRHLMPDQFYLTAHVKAQKKKSSKRASS